MTDELRPADDDDDDGAPTEQPTTDATKATSAKQQRIKQLTDREKAREFWSRVLRDPVGGLVIFNMLRDLHVFSDEHFACGPNGFPSVEATYHARGQRDFGLRLYRTLILHDREAVFALHDRHDSAFARPDTRRKKPKAE